MITLYHCWPNSMHIIMQLPLLDESGINVSALLKKTLSSPDVRILEVLCCMITAIASILPLVQPSYL